MMKTVKHKARYDGREKMEKKDDHLSRIKQDH